MIFIQRITAAFKNTRTYLAIKQAYAAAYGMPPYARLPEAEIRSLKISSRFTTAEFSKAVETKYQQCFKKVELQTVSSNMATEN